MLKKTKLNEIKTQAMKVQKQKNKIGEEKVNQNKIQNLSVSAQRVRHIIRIKETKDIQDFKIQ